MKVRLSSLYVIGWSCWAFAFVASGQVPSSSISKASRNILSSSRSLTVAPSVSERTRESIAAWEAGEAVNIEPIVLLVELDPLERDPGAEILVFLNKQGEHETPLQTDPNFVSSFGLYSAVKGFESSHAKFYVDITKACSRIKQMPNQHLLPLQITLVLAPLGGRKLPENLQINIRDVKVLARDEWQELKRRDAASI